MGREGQQREVRVSELFRWTAKQQAAQAALKERRFLLYGGARGGGKSYWLRWALLYLLLDWARQGITGACVGLFCATYPELRDRQITKIVAEFPAWLGELRDSKEHGLGFHLRAEYGGGVILLRNLDNPEKYKSAEYAAIGIDELTLIQKATFDILRGSLRWPGISDTKFLSATNPDGVGNLWVRQLWIEKDFPPEMREIAGQFAFIQALPTDNEHLDAQYWTDLRSQPPDVQRAWIEGDWYVFSGQAFKFRNNLHVIEPIEIPEHWLIKRGVDWGSHAPWCCLWGARNPDNGRWIVYREAYQTDLTDRQQARLILDMTPATEKVAITYADPSMWTEKQKGVASSAVVYSQNGINLTRAGNDRIDGKRRIDRLLMPLPDGLPGLQVVNTCPNLIRTLPALVYDKTRIEDVNTDGEDHAYDALRYLTTGSGEYTNKQREIRRRTSPLMEVIR